jgi:TonB family protein
VSPVDHPGQSARTVAPGGASAAASRPLYGGLSPKVTPPVVIRQRLPAWIPRDLEWQATRQGVIDIVINEQGDVESATIVKPIYPGYDQLVLQAAKNWKYQPATIDNAPVRFVKSVAVQLQPK